MSDENEKMSLRDIWVWPMAIAWEYLGLAGMIFIIPYFVATVIGASVGVCLLIMNTIIFAMELLFESPTP
jgi:hypothetical protein